MDGGVLYYSSSPKDSALCNHHTFHTYCTSANIIICYSLHKRTSSKFETCDLNVEANQSHGNARESIVELTISKHSNL